MKLINRTEASALGLKRYYTGKPCKHGHVAERLTTSNSCTVCDSIRKKRWYLDNAEQTKARVKRNYYDDPAAHNSRVVKWQASNRDKVSRIKSDWKKRNPEKIRADVRARKTRFQYAPSHEREAIAQFYIDKPEGYEVDHEIPIHHELVCGLHCIANLQYLTIEDNRRKSNKWNQE